MLQKSDGDIAVGVYRGDSTMAGEGRASEREWILMWIQRSGGGGAGSAAANPTTHTLSMGG